MGTLEHKRIVVTGGARGIGASTVRALVREGAVVAALDVLVEPGQELVRTLAGPGRAVFLPCDVTQRADVQEAVAASVAELGGLDGLVHAAGVETRAPAELLSDDDWDTVLDVSLRGAFLTNQAAFPHLVAAGGGRVLNFASGAGIDPFPGAAHYSAAKAGVVAWTRTIAHEWGRHGITCNSVVPAMWTPMYEATRGHMDAERLAAHDVFMASRIPLGGRLGSADDDLAPVMVFLLSDASHFITGQVLCVDGGLSSVR